LGTIIEKLNGKWASLGVMNSLQLLIKEDNLRFSKEP